MVSVIIPSYNRYDSLLNAIASVHAQTFSKYEVLVIDDCSTDERYEKTHWDAMGVRYFKTEKNYKNPYRARNIGMHKAQNELLAFLDDDDTWLPNKLEVQVPLMLDRYLFTSTEAYYSNEDVTYQEGKVYKKYLTEQFWDFISKHYGISEFPEIIKRDMLETWNILITSSVMIHRSLVYMCGIFVKDPLKPKWEDWVYFQKCLEHTDCFFIKEPLVFYNDAPRNKYISRT
jgi:glycosyltransferase involved in cell wall biosynthesis